MDGWMDVCVFLSKTLTTILKAMVGGRCKKAGCENGFAEYLTYTAYFMKVFICYTIYALILFFLKCFILQKETIIDPLVVALKEGRKCFI